MERSASRRREYAWLAAVVLTSLPLLLSLFAAMWRAPYPISETVSLLEDDVDASPSTFFSPTRRSWYRPLYHLTWWTFWRGAGSLDGALFWFKVLEITTVIVLVALFLWHLRPWTLIEGAAATLALAVLVGMPGFRANLELPLLMTLVGMPLALVVWMLLEREARWWHAPVIVALTLIAIGFKEQGLVIAPLVVAAWWTDAPGATRTTTALVVASVVAYLAMRLATSGGWSPFEQDVGLGFSKIPAAEASARFGAFPLWMYAYNGASTVANVLFSEPTDGQFRIVWDVIHRQVDAWELNHVISSTVLTVLIAWWGFGTLKRNARRPRSVESRVFIAAAMAIAASGALGFNYSRDRLGGMAVVFYAIAAFFAVRAAAERAVNAAGARMAATVVALLLLGGAWGLRAIGTVEDVRLSAARNRREWMVDLQERRTDFARQPTYLRLLEAMAPQGLDPSSARPTAYPRWFRGWVGPPARSGDASPAGSLADAIADGDVERAYAFIRAGQDPNATIPFSHPDLTGDRQVMVSPLLLAVATHRDNVVSMLLSFGARLDLPQNKFAVCLAQQTGDKQIAEILMKLGGPAAKVECPAPKPGLLAPLLAFVE